MSNEIKPLSQCKTVAEIFADPARWTQGAMARRADRRLCSRFSHEAVCFCLAGAINQIYGMETGRMGVYAKVGEALVGTGMIPWNDHPERKFEEVQALVKKLNI